MPTMPMFAGRRCIAYEALSKTSLSRLRMRMRGLGPAARRLGQCDFRKQNAYLPPCVSCASYYINFSTVMGVVRIQEVDRPEDAVLLRVGRLVGMDGPMRAVPPTAEEGCLMHFLEEDPGKATFSNRPF